MVTDFSKLKKILVIRLSSLGDVLLTTPLIRAMKKKNPSIQIDFVVREQFSDAVQYNPNLNKIYKYSNSKSEKTRNPRMITRAPTCLAKSTVRPL